ncbi:MAG: hypothetical protein RLZZ546_2356 [Bacteroidota bacterium]|jgi:subtilisin family serine protease
MKSSVVFSLLSCVLSKRYIVQTSNLPDVSVFSSLNTKETFIVGDLVFTIVESDTFPVFLYNHNFVESVEEDGVVSIDDYGQFILINDDNDFYPEKSYFLQNNPPWGLDRADQKSNMLNNKYYHPVHGGANVDVYVIDTGIDIKHPEFEGRATWGSNFVDNVNTDCNSHGTHVAGTIGSKTFGIAKKTNLVAVKVLNCEGSGSFSGILASFEYVIKRKQQTKKSSLVNMSLGGGKSNSINRAVAELVKNDITVVVAAGNENQDACNVSPASAEEAISVGATSRNNQLASFSNWGKCVNLLAPGVDIMSTVPGNNSRQLSGTSMASPHVAGYVALVLNENPSLTPNAVKKFLTTQCTKDVVSGVKHETPNCLMYTIF